MTHNTKTACVCQDVHWYTRRYCQDESHKKNCSLSDTWWKFHGVNVTTLPNHTPSWVPMPAHRLSVYLQYALKCLLQAPGIPKTLFTCSRASATDYIPLPKWITVSFIEPVLRSLARLIWSQKWLLQWEMLTVDQKNETKCLIFVW